MPSFRDLITPVGRLKPIVWVATGHKCLITFTTAPSFWRRFPQRRNNITVMTNSLHIVNALSEFDNEQTILMPGGTFRKKSASFHGQLAENAFEQFSFDKLFMGTDGIDLNAGVTTFNEVYTVSKAMCNAAREVILMADSSKFGRKSPNIVCGLERVDKLITDADIDPEFQRALEAKGIEVIITGEHHE